MESKAHQLDDDAKATSLPEVGKGPALSSSTNTTPIPVARDPSLPEMHDPLSYINVFVNDSFCSVQTTSTAWQVCNILMHVIDDVFRPIDPNHVPFRHEPVSIKKLQQVDCPWRTIKLVMGWIIDTTIMTIHMPPHLINWLFEILHSIPTNQKRTSIKKWHSVLGELRSMALALPEHLVQEVKVSNIPL